MSDLKMEVSISELHDAELNALRHNSDSGTLECIFQTMNGQDILLVLQGVTRFRCTDFGLQNVTLEVIVADSASKLAREELRPHIAWLMTTCDGEQLASREEIDQLISEIISGTSQCVILIPSWGARLTAVADTVQWRLCELLGSATIADKGVDAGRAL